MMSHSAATAAGRVGPARAGLDEALARLAPDVVHHQPVAARRQAALQIVGHAGTHGAEADEPRLHGCVPPYGFASNTSRAMFAADIAAGQPA